eukprot:2773939-Pleurochrysis_carterae.AAC.3
MSTSCERLSRHANAIYCGAGQQQSRSTPLSRGCARACAEAERPSWHRQQSVVDLSVLLGLGHMLASKLACRVSDAVSSAVQIKFGTIWEGGLEIPPFAIDNMSAVEFLLAAFDSTVGCSSSRSFERFVRAAHWHSRRLYDAMLPRILALRGASASA